MQSDYNFFIIFLSIMSENCAKFRLKTTERINKLYKIPTISQKSLDKF
jgi:hypothetical protein